MSRVAQLTIEEALERAKLWDGEDASDECVTAKIYFFKDAHDGTIHLMDFDFTNGFYQNAWCWESIRGNYMVEEPDENDTYCEVCFPQMPPKGAYAWRLVPVTNEEDS